MAAYLVVISGSDRGREWPLADGGRCVVGRSEGADFQLSDPVVSRRHFQVISEDGACRLTDLESSSGTFVNGERTPSCELIPGDRIRIGSTVLTFETDDSRIEEAGSPEIAVTAERGELARFVGRSFQGYDIEEILAAGSRSVVFRARNQKTGKPVALKILQSELTHSDEERQRFVRSIKVVAVAKSPHLVQIQAAGRKGQNYWVAMEFVAGESLPAFVARAGKNGSLAPEDVVRLGIDITHALCAIREHKFLHRNISPENILYDAEQDLFKLNGLTLAKALEGQWSQDLTAAGVVLGDVGCYAPEQLRGSRDVDGRVDLYSLGATLYSVLTGQAPFRLDNMPHVLKVVTICSQVPPRPRSLRPDIPAALDDLVMKLLEKKPEDRYATPDELLDALESMTGDAADDATDAAPSDSTPPGESVVVALQGVTPPAQTARPVAARHPSRRSAMRWLPAGIVAALVLVVVVLGTRSRSKSKQRVVPAQDRLESVTVAESSPVTSRGEFLRGDEPVGRMPERSPFDEDPPPRSLAANMPADNSPFMERSSQTKSPFAEPSEAAATPSTKNVPATPAPEKSPFALPVEPIEKPRVAADTAVAQPKRSNIIAGSAVDIVAFINQEVRKGWTENGATPTAVADDSEWLRRVHLDLVGTIPAVDVVEAFLADKNPAKRARIIERLLDTQDYVTHWSTLWTNLSVGRFAGQRTGRNGMLRFFREAFARNRAWNDIVVDLLSAEGHFEENGAVNFVLIDLPGAARDAAEITDKTTRLLMGIQLQCTQCHNHPFNDWQQRLFWEFNSFFRGAQRVEYMKYDARQGISVFDYAELINQPVTQPVYFERRSGLMEVAYPKYFGQAVELAPDSNRRRELAQLMIAGERPLIALAQVNRMWAHFFGYGLTRPFDDMGPHNPASHPDLLNRLADEFVKNQYDLKQLIRWIVSCDAYHLASRRDSTDKVDNPTQGDTPLFSHYYLKALSPETLCESLSVATSLGDVAAVNREQWDRTRLQLLNQLLQNLFGNMTDDITAYSGSIPQMLLLMNGDFVKQVTSSQPGSLVPALCKQYPADPERTRILYLKILGREPDRAEAALVVKQIGRRKDKDPVPVYQNLVWALLNSNEFAVNH